MKQYAIADIHGCFEAFKNLLDRIGLNKSDALYLLGDYINRGADSKKVVDTIMHLQEQGYRIHPLKGNHEEMIFDSIHLDDWTAGATETLTSFGISHLKELDSKYLRWFRGLENSLEKEDYLFVHAGYDFQNPTPTPCLWIKDWYDSIHHKWLKNRKIIHGHVPISQRDIQQMLDRFDLDQVLNIDNGCFLNNVSGYGSLCCVELTERVLWFERG